MNSKTTFFTLRRGFISPSALIGGTCLLLAALVLAIFFLSARSATDEKPEQATLIQAREEPIRIAALLPFAADQLIKMGHTPVAVPSIRGDVPAAWDGIETIAIDHAAGPNLEQLIALSPDVIITSGVYAQFIPAMENEVGAQVISMDVDSIASVTEHMSALGKLISGETAAKPFLDEVSKTLGSMATQSEHSPTTLAIFGTPHAFYAFLPDSYLGDLIEISGGELITADMQSHPVFQGLAPISMEAVIDRDPELLLVVFHGPEESARAMLEQDPLWSEIQAVKNDRVAFLKDDLYAMRPGSEFSRALSDIKAIVQPEVATVP